MDDAENDEASRRPDAADEAKSRPVLTTSEGLVSPPLGAEDIVARFAALTADIGRFMNGCAGLPAFLAGLSFSEWALLTQLRLDDGADARRIGTQLGMGRKRVRQAFDALLERRLVAKDQDDEKGLSWFITDIGKETLANVDGEIATTFAAVDPLYFLDISIRINVLGRVNIPRH